MIFSEGIHEYSLKTSPLSSPAELNSGLWLVLAGVNDIPPHIALIHNGKYYSVSTRKVDLGEPIEKFLKALSRNTLPAIFVSVKPGEENIDNFLLQSFRAYNLLGKGDHSCLFPVRDFFAKAFSIEFGGCSLVFELLALAQDEDMLIESKSLFVDTPNNVLPKYTKQQIQERINALIVKG